MCPPCNTVSRGSEGLLYDCTISTVITDTRLSNRSIFMSGLWHVRARALYTPSAGEDVHVGPCIFGAGEDATQAR